MDTTTRKLVKLLDGGDLELRMAAMRIIAELEVGGKSAVRLLGRSLREAPSALKIHALKGLLKLGAKEVINYVIPLLEEQGELRDRALEVVISVGEPACSKLLELYPEGDYNTKRSIATALSEIASPKSFEFFFEALVSESFELQKHMSQCLTEAIDRLPESKLPKVFKQTLAFLEDPKTHQDLQALVIGIIILGRFRGLKQLPKVRNALISYVDPKHAPEVRRYAMIAFYSTLEEAPLKPDHLKFLENCLSDPDWNNVAMHALNAFHKLGGIPKKTLQLLKLLETSPHHQVHIHVFELLAKENRPEVAKAIIPFLQDPSYRVREAAEEALRAMNSAVKELLDTMKATEDPDFSQLIVTMLKDYPLNVRKRVLKEAVETFLHFFEGHDRRSQVYLEFIRGVDPEPLRKAIYKVVSKIRRSKSPDKWENVSRYLQVLWDHHLITPEGRYLFALSLIKQSRKNLSPLARQRNLGLQVMRALIYDDTPGLVARLIGNRDLKPDDYFYIGFHFIELGEEMLPFATSILEYIMQKHSRSSAAKVAQQKLELVREELANPAGKKNGKKRKARSREIEQAFEATQDNLEKIPADAKAPKAGKETEDEESKKVAAKKIKKVAKKATTKKEKAKAAPKSKKTDKKSASKKKSAAKKSPSKSKKSGSSSSKKTSKTKKKSAKKTPASKPKSRGKSAANKVSAGKGRGKPVKKSASKKNVKKSAKRGR